MATTASPTSPSSETDATLAPEPTTKEMADLKNKFPKGCRFSDPEQCKAMKDVLSRGLPTKPPAPTLLAVAQDVALSFFAGWANDHSSTGKWAGSFAFRRAPPPLEDVYVWIALHMMDLDEPAGQAAHADSVDWPVRFPKVPASQSVTDAEPSGQ